MVVILRFFYRTFLVLFSCFSFLFIAEANTTLNCEGALALEMDSTPTFDTSDIEVLVNSEILQHLEHYKGLSNAELIAEINKWIVTAGDYLPGLDPDDNATSFQELYDDYTTLSNLDRTSKIVNVMRNLMMSEETYRYILLNNESFLVPKSETELKKIFKKWQTLAWRPVMFQVVLDRIDEGKIKYP
ncbi:MAG: hypothetical protein KDD58_09880 [Bdellovibrionales bacterium]|nr:hypothetical protein [Bdellovibrionales bacterium]